MNDDKYTALQATNDWIKHSSSEEFLKAFHESSQVSDCESTPTLGDMIRFFNLDISD